MIPKLIAAAIAVLLSTTAATAMDDQAKPAAPAHATHAPEPAPPAPPVPGPPQPRHEGQAVNVRVDITITEQQGSGAPSKKTVTLVVVDGESGAARSNAHVQLTPSTGYQTLPLNVDVQPRMIDEHRVRLRIVLNWGVLAPGRSGEMPISTEVTEQVTPILESGKALVVAQSADPVSDRQVTVEAKATVLR